MESRASETMIREACCMSESSTVNIYCMLSDIMRANNNIYITDCHQHQWTQLINPKMSEPYIYFSVLE